MLKSNCLFYFLRFKTQIIYFLFQKRPDLDNRILRFYLLLSRLKYSKLYRKDLNSLRLQEQKSNLFLLIYDQLEDLGGANLMGRKIRDELIFQKNIVREIDWANFLAMGTSERAMFSDYTPVVINCKRALVYFSQIPDLPQIVAITWNHSDLYFKLASYFSKISRAFYICEPVLTTDFHFLFEFPNFSLRIQITDCHHKTELSEIKVRPRLVFIGRLNHQKGVDVFLRLARANKNLDFIVIGSGPFENFVVRQTFKQKNLLFLGKHENPLCFVRATDIVILPSRYFEGLNLVLLEAIRHGVQVISSGVGLMAKVHSDLHSFPEKESIGNNSYKWFQEKLKEVKF